jgi:hypothetical protein
MGLPLLVVPFTIDKRVKSPGDPGVVGYSKIRLLRLG